MNAFTVLVLLCASLVLSAPIDPCNYVKTTQLLSDLSLVQQCFATYTVPQDFTDAIVRTLDIVGDLYPYVEIDQNPPNATPGYFKKVDYKTDLEKLKMKLANSKNILSNVVRPTQEFISSFHDGHFSLRFYENMTENVFANVYIVIPFAWDLVNVDEKTATVRMGESKYSKVFMTEKDYKVLTVKQANNVAVKSVDDIDAFKFFTEFGGVYNDMKSRQGSLQFIRYISTSGCPFLSAPLDDDVLFKTHTVTYVDGDTLSFNITFVNQNAHVAKTMDIPKIPPLPFPETSTEDELRIGKALSSMNPATLKKSDPKNNQFLPCGTVDGMNYIIIFSFGVSSEEEAQIYVEELFGCAAKFDENELPIAIILPMNGGGLLQLEQMIEFVLMPNSDYRLFTAIRKSERSRHVALDWEFAAQFANMSDDCNYLHEDRLEEYWKPDVVDDFGEGIKHVRTQKSFVAYKNLGEEYGGYAMHKHIRKPTDILIATDGFCFSACSILVLNSIRQGSAIVTGYGSTYPGDTQFVAGQCPSSTITPADLFDEVKNNTYHGITFHNTFFETYNISTSMDEKIPGDFEILRIDKHMGFYKPLTFTVDEMVPYLKAVHEEFQTKCNPANHHLLFVDKKCRVKDPNALDSGYPCGADGTWDKSQCLISTCKPGYVVDFEHNKCIPNSCDFRLFHHGSSSAAGSSSGSGSGSGKGSNSSAAAFSYPSSFLSFIFVFFVIASFLF